MAIFPSYLFSAFSEVYYQKLASYTRAANLVANTVSATAGQAVYSTTQTVYYLLCASVITGVVSSVLSAFLPKQQQGPLSVDIQQQYTTSKWEILKEQFKKAVANYNKPLIAWSCWAGVCMGIHVLILTYWQSLMYEIDPSVNYNGYVSTVAYLLAAAVALIPTRIESLLESHALWLLGISPIINGTMVLLWSLESNIYRAYIYFILYLSCYFMHAVSAAQIAIKIGKPKQFGLVFSLNVLLTILFQNSLQFILGKNVLNFTPHTQYQYMAIILFIVGVVCLGVNVWIVVLKKRSGRALLRRSDELEPLAHETTVEPTDP
jgi:hypothetical protein